MFPDYSKHDISNMSLSDAIKADRIDLAILSAHCVHSTITSLDEDLSTFLAHAQNVRAAFHYLSALSHSAADLADNLAAIRSQIIDPYHKTILTCVIDFLRTIKTP